MNFKVFEKDAEYPDFDSSSSDLTSNMSSLDNKFTSESDTNGVQIMKGTATFNFESTIPSGNYYILIETVGLTLCPVTLEVILCSL